MRTAKVLIPNKSWIVVSNGAKIATVNKLPNGYQIASANQQVSYHTLDELREQFDISLEHIEGDAPPKVVAELYGYPVKDTVFNTLWHIHKGLPVYTKSGRSTSQFCAGYYLICYNSQWVKKYCPKLLTLSRYPYAGPYKSVADLVAAHSTYSRSEFA